jgi:hypothetical protein
LARPLEEVAKELWVVEFENATGRDVAEEDHRNDGLVFNK